MAGRKVRLVLIRDMTEQLNMERLLRDNLLIYGLGGLVAPFIGIKIIDLLLTLMARQARGPVAVLDPFSGSGTTGMVATEMGRKYIGCELNPDYAEMSAKRIESWKHRDAKKASEPLPAQRELF